MGRGGYSKGRAAKGKPRDSTSKKSRDGEIDVSKRSGEDCADLDDASGEGSENSCDESVEDNCGDECEVAANSNLQVKLVVFEFAQNDPKVDSGYKMTRMGIARAIKPMATFHGVILSPRSQIVVSALDRECLLSYGLAGINASWNRMDELPWSRLQKQGRHRILPNLLAANAINYGRPMKLNTAEAMAATLLIAGLDDAAEIIMRAFSWGDEFLKINLERFAAYASARDPAGVRQQEAALLARMDAERAERKANTEMDLPPSESEGEESEDDDCQANATIEQAHSRSPEEEVSFSSIWELYRAAKKEQEEARVVEDKERELLELKYNEPREKKPIAKPRVDAETPSKPSLQSPAKAEVPVAIESDAVASNSEAVCIIAEDHPAPAPKDMKAVLGALQTMASVDFQKSVGLAGLSGNALAKLKRPEFESLWRRFCIEEAPRLSADQARAIIAPASSAQAPKGGPKKR